MNLKKIISIYKFAIKFLEYKNLFYISILFYLVSTILFYPLPKLSGMVIDDLVSTKPNVSNIKLYIGLIVVINFVRFILNVIYKKNLSKLSIQTANAIKACLIEKVLYLPLNYFNMHDIGYIISRVHETSGISEVLNVSIINSFFSMFEVVICLLIVFKMNIYVFLVLILSIPIIYHMTRKKIESYESASLYNMEENAKFNGILYGIINGVEEVKNISMYKKTIEIMSKKITKLNFAKYNMVKKSVVIVEEIIYFNTVLSSVILIISVLLILNGHMTIGAYVAVTGYVIKCTSGIQVLANLKIMLKPIFVTYDRVLEIIEMTDERQLSSSKTELDEIKTIVLSNVSFSYTDSLIINDFNLKINRNDKLKLVGKNGAGKSTILKLIYGLYYPKSGNIYINDKKITDINILKYRTNIGVVTQHTYLFQGTILENISHNSQSITKEEVISKMNEKKIYFLLDYFEDGLDSKIAIGGDNLSGGQKQIVSFIRVMLSDCDFLILDELSSSLDESLKKSINKIISNLKDKTILAVSHESGFLQEFKEIKLDRGGHYNE